MSLSFFKYIQDVYCFLFLKYLEYCHIEISVFWRVDNSVVEEEYNDLERNAYVLTG